MLGKTRNKSFFLSPVGRGARVKKKIITYGRQKTEFITETLCTTGQQLDGGGCVCVQYKGVER